MCVCNDEHVKMENMFFHDNLLVLRLTTRVEIYTAMVSEIKRNMLRFLKWMHFDLSSLTCCREKLSHHVVELFTPERRRKKLKRDGNHGCLLRLKSDVFSDVLLYTHCILTTRRIYTRIRNIHRYRNNQMAGYLANWCNRHR